MNITVNIEYRTAWGERLVLVTAEGKRVDMSCSGSKWVAMFSLPKSAKSISYHFEVLNSEGNTIRTEWGEGHNYTLAADANEEMFTAINNALNELIADGSVQQIIDKYINANE